MSETSRVKLEHMPALDGLRGMAVGAVLLFHGGKLSGGYMGVDLFFVLSGFLITSLLLAEWEARGSIDLKEFWTRRARRLLPALFGVLAAVVVLAIFVAKPYELESWRWDSIVTLFYGANWRQISTGSGYWDQFNAPSPLRHSWSLAIEEQFYLVWPLVFIGVLRLAKDSRRVLLAVATGGALLSATLMAALYNDADPNRVYLGSDTRAAAVLLGASLAIALALWRPVGGRRSRVALESVALLSAAVLLTIWAFADPSSAWLYRYGFFACGILCVAVIASASHPVRGPMGAALSWRPLRGLGLISYGLYLWHWPVYVSMDANKQWFDARGVGGWSFLMVKVAVSLVFAIASYFVIEAPIRRTGLAAWPRPALMPAAACMIVLALVWSTLGAEQRPVVTPPVLAAAGAPELAGLPEGADARTPLPDLADDPEASALANTTTIAPPAGPVSRPPGRAARVLVVGDSVAWTLGQSIERQARLLGIKVLNRAMFACPLSKDSNRTRERGIAPVTERPVCRDWPTNFLYDVSRFRPDVVLMLYGGPPPQEREIGGEFVGLCDPRFAQWYRPQVSEALDILTSTGAVVYVAPQSYMRFPFVEWAPRDDLTDCINKAYREVAPTKLLARVVPLDSFVCPTRETCVEHVDGVKLRDDGIHFDGAGSDLVARWLVGQMLL